MNSTSEQSSKRVAVAIDIEEVVPWHQDCCEGILRYGRSHGWSCTVTPYLVGPAGKDAAGYYDGVVGRIDLELAEEARALDIPAVNHMMNSPAKGLPSIGVDTRLGGQMIGEHLITCGYHSLQYLGGYQDNERVRYLEGLSKAADQAGLAPPSKKLFQTGESLTSSREVFSDFLRDLDHWIGDIKTPVGLMIAESTLATYTVQQCLARGLSVPNDVGIVTWQDDVSTNSISPTLSVIEVDWSEVGYQAAAMLDELMQGKTIHPQHRLIPPTRLIQNESTDVFLSSDELVSDTMRYIADHCREALKIEDIAEALYVHRRTIEKRFMMVLGKTVHAEIIRLRVEHIKRVLIGSDLPLTTIAFDCGFSSASYFATYFRKATGMSPSQFRKQYRAEKEG